MKASPAPAKTVGILEHDPHAVIEGVIIAGLAVGARVGFVYIRGEYRYLVDIMRKAIADAYAKGYLGKNIFGSGKDFDVRWHTGAGAYEVGEESALMESLEGKRGIPPIRPSFPPWLGYGAALRSSITLRLWRPFPTLFLWAAKSLPTMAHPRTAAHASSA